MIKPPRPVRRPEEFYQVFLGGVDEDYMTTSLGGYTGCLRGLSVGGNILDLTSKGADGIARGKLPLFQAFHHHSIARCYMRLNLKCPPVLRESFEHYPRC
jgi:hypothetical protein